MTLHSFPGMGADHRMYPDPWPSLPGFIGHDWDSYDREKSLPEMAKAICTAKKIKDGDSIIGSSFGGILACEIANLRNISKIYLVGSAQHRSEVNSLLLKMAPLVNYVPLNLTKSLAGKLGSPLSQMFNESNPEFIRAMCLALSSWRGLNPDLTTKIYRIHGRNDLIIPTPKSADLCLDAGHFIAITHAQNCVQFIESTLCRSS